MINKMDRYIARHVTSATLLVIIVLTLLSASFALLAETGALRMGYHFSGALAYVVASMPATILQLLPVSVLIGCITGLGILAGHNELVIMQVSGMSRFRICLAAIKPVIVFIIVAMLLGEFVVPGIQYNAEQKRMAERSLNHDWLESGLWWRDGNDFMYIGKIHSKLLENIDIFQFNSKHKLEKTIRAKQAIKTGGVWQLRNVEVVNITPNKTIRTVQSELAWNIHLDSHLLKIATTQPDTLSMRNLSTYIKYIKKQHLDSRLYELSLYGKLLQPLTIISLLLIGVSFVFGPLRSVSMGYRLFMGISAGIIFMLVRNLMSPVSIVFNFSPLVAILLPDVVCLAIALFLLRRSR